MTDLSKEALIEALRQFVRQRPRLAELGYGGDVTAYRHDSREVTRDRDDALLMLGAVDGRASREALLSMLSGAGRLTLKGDRLEYCASQSYAHEYRAAVCQLCSRLLWDHWRQAGCETATDIRKRASNYFGRGLANRWFR